MLGRQFEEAVEVAAAFEVDEREAQRAACHAACHAEHVVGHAELPGVLVHPSGDFRRQRNEEHRAQQHQLHHARTEGRIPEAHRFAELVGGDRCDCVDVDGDARHRLDHGPQDGALSGRDPARRRARQTNGSRDHVHLVRRRRHQEHLVGAR